jgi:hypothetical protein
MLAKRLIMKTFLEYQIHRIKQDNPKRLKTLMKVLIQSGLFVNDHTEDEDCHLFVTAMPPPQEFEGVRIYCLGNICAYRVQKLKDTEPYGKSYLLDLQKTFDDILEERGMKTSNKDVVEAFIERLGKELRKFFKTSIKDEDEFIQSQMDAEDKSDPASAMVLPAYSPDYSSSVYSTRN